jgi:DNA-binding NarL/FixJ family response regulator
LSQKLQPDVLLLASNITEPPWPDIFIYLRKYCPAVKVLALLECTETVCYRNLTDGVRGGIFKSEPPEKLVEAVQIIYQGESWFSQSLLQKLIQQKTNRRSVSDTLTKQELEVLRLLVEQKTDSEIAQALSMSERNLRRCLRRIYDKLRVDSRVGAAFEAGRLGLFEYLSNAVLYNPIVVGSGREDVLKRPKG